MIPDADPIDVNRTAEALGLTRLAIPPPAWPGNGGDPFEWPEAESGPPPGDARPGNANAAAFEAEDGDAADATAGV